MTTAAPRAARPDRVEPAVGDAAGRGGLGALRDSARRFRAAVEEAGR
ncbi:hypothetical protein [Streptomyces nigra]